LIAKTNGLLSRFWQFSHLGKLGLVRKQLELTSSSKKLLTHGVPCFALVRIIKEHLLTPQELIPS
jgi:hypothetical protein